MKLSFYGGIVLKLLKAHANQGISPVTLGDFNFSTSISHRCWALTLIYGLGLTSVSRERVLPGRVCCRGDSDESRMRPSRRSRVTWWDTANKPEEPGCVFHSIQTPVGTFPSLRDSKNHLLSSGAGPLIALWRAHDHGAMMARDSPNKSMSNYLPISTAAASVPLSRALLLQGIPVLHV